MFLKFDAGDLFAHGFEDNYMAAILDSRSQKPGGLEFAQCCRETIDGEIRAESSEPTSVFPPGSTASLCRMLTGTGSADAPLSDFFTAARNGAKLLGLNFSGISTYFENSFVL